VSPCLVLARWAGQFLIGSWPNCAGTFFEDSPSTSPFPKGEIDNTLSPMLLLEPIRDNLSAMLPTPFHADSYALNSFPFDFQRQEVWSEQPSGWCLNILRLSQVLDELGDRMKS